MKFSFYGLAEGKGGAGGGRFVCVTMGFGWIAFEFGVCVCVLQRNGWK